MFPVKQRLTLRYQEGGKAFIFQYIFWTRESCLDGRYTVGHFLNPVSPIGIQCGLCPRLFIARTLLASRSGPRQHGLRGPSWWALSWASHLAIVRSITLWSILWGKGLTWDGPVSVTLSLGPVLQKFSRRMVIWWVLLLLVVTRLWGFATDYFRGSLAPGTFDSRGRVCL